MAIILSSSATNNAAVSQRSLKDRLLSRTKIDVAGCWEWSGWTMQNGYGQIGVGGRMKLTHRVSYELHCGPIPHGQRVCHHCDNPRCVNPEHLFLGTPAENSADMVAKGRQATGNKVARKGAANGRAKLTETDVVTIRTAQGGRGLQTMLARQYGVSTTLISALRAGKHWPHL